MAAAVALSAGSCSGSGSSSTNAEADGEAVYAKSCASCHGPDLRGTDRGPSFFSQVYEPAHHPDDAFRAAITKGSPAHHWGFGDMPPVTGLGNDEIDAVIHYIRRQQERHGFEPYPPG